MDATEMHAAAKLTVTIDVNPLAPKRPKPTAETPVTAMLYAALSAMYAHFNAALFDGALLPVALTFSRQANSAGFFAPERWESATAVTHEIAINPHGMARNPREMAQTLVHEMAHCWQQEHGTPGRKGYHNEEWARKMDEIGLAPSSTHQPGGKRTGYKMGDYVVEGGRFEAAYKSMPDACKLPWLCREGRGGLLAGGADGDKDKKPASKVKFSCPGCMCNAWGKPSLRLTCTDCQQEMVADVTAAEVAAEEGGES